MFMEEMEYVSEIRKEECYLNFATKKNYAWQTRGLRRRTTERQRLHLAIINLKLILS